MSRHHFHREMPLVLLDIDFILWIKLDQLYRLKCVLGECNCTYYQYLPYVLWAFSRSMCTMNMSESSDIFVHSRWWASASKFVHAVLHFITVTYIPLQNCNKYGLMRYALAVNGVSFIVLCVVFTFYCMKNLCCKFTFEIHYYHST